MSAARAALLLLGLLASACRVAPLPTDLVGSYRGETATHDVDLFLREDGSAWYLELEKEYDFIGGHWPTAAWSFESPEPEVELVRFLPGPGDRRQAVRFAVDTTDGRRSLLRADGVRLERVR
jgi:hypothetical protein